ncbi:hypothetical protein MAPG_08612, partial [Magnaporthiopsis poae ATCC 64411]
MGDTSFHWRLPGLDRDRFEALAKLLRLRNGSQLHEPASNFDILPDDEDAEDGDPITASAQHGTGQDIKLTKSFLDGLAELVAGVRGRDHVSATLLIRRPDRLEILVARGKELEWEDPAAEMLGRLQAGLRQIAALGYDDPRSGPVGAKLWEALVYAYRSRIIDYTRDVQEAFARIGWTPEPPTPRLVDTALRSARLELLGLYGAVGNTHDISTLADFGSLVIRAHYLRGGYSNGTVAKALGEPHEAAGMPELIAAIGSLGRLARVFGAFARATTLPGFDNLHMVPVTVNPFQCSPESQQDVPWSLEAAFAALDLQPHPMSVAQVMGKASATTAGRVKSKKPRSNKAKGKGGKPHPLSFAELQAGFDNLQGVSSEPHAEVQLALAAATWRQDEGGGMLFPYAGCSKKSCLLCATFLQEYQGLMTRGCHGKLYGTWTVPSLDLDADAVKNVVKAVEAVERAMKSALLSTAAVASPARGKASGSARRLLSTTTATSPPRDCGDDRAWTEWIVQGQLQAKHVSASAAVASPAVDGPEVAAVVDDPEVADVREGDPISLPSTELPATDGDGEIGECDFCERDTSRRCSACGRGYFCSERCQEKMDYFHLKECSYRDMTTADRLFGAMATDSLPTDVQTLEDFGFTRCRHPKEECSLFGLYHGLLSPSIQQDEDDNDVAGRLRQWQQSGTLAENIIRSFSRLPEGTRGGYFPWFLRNRHVFDFSVPAPDEQTRARRMLQAAVERGRRYLAAAEGDQDHRGYRPWAERHCFLFCALA